MVKEGEGGVTSPRKGRSGLQRATGQGKETEGIKYPMPTPMTLAFIEEEFGSLDSIRKNPLRHAYRITLMLVFFLEMQKEGRQSEVAGMTAKERREAASELFDPSKITIGEKFDTRAKAAMEVFTSALGASRVR